MALGELMYRDLHLGHPRRRFSGTSTSVADDNRC